jgi:hypothetical protein
MTELRGGEDSNSGANPTIHEVSDPARRMVLGKSLAATLSAMFRPAAMPVVGGCAARWWRDRVQGHFGLRHRCAGRA